MVSSQWGLPPQFENSVAFRKTYSRTNTATISTSGIFACAAQCADGSDLARTNHQMALERSAQQHDPVPQRIWLSGRRDRHDRPRRLNLDVVARGTASFRSRRRRQSHQNRHLRRQLPPSCRGLDAAPPLMSDIDLSLDDEFLYVACWGTGGEMRQYDVTEPGEHEAHRLRPYRRHRRTHVPPERQRLRGRPADGRDEP